MARAFPSDNVRGTTFPDSCCGYVGEGSSTKLTELCLYWRYSYIVTNSTDFVFVACSMLNAAEQQKDENYSKSYGYKIDKPTDSESILFSDEKQLNPVKSVGSLRNNKCGQKRKSFTLFHYNFHFVLNDLVHHVVLNNC